MENTSFVKRWLTHGIGAGLNIPSGLKYPAELLVKTMSVCTRDRDRTKNPPGLKLSAFIKLMRMMHIFGSS
jgi:hypothetical protein